MLERSGGSGSGRNQQTSGSRETPFEILMQIQELQATTAAMNQVRANRSIVAGNLSGTYTFEEFVEKFLPHTAANCCGKHDTSSVSKNKRKKQTQKVGSFATESDYESDEFTDSEDEEERKKQRKPFAFFNIQPEPEPMPMVARLHPRISALYAAAGQPRPVAGPGRSALLAELNDDLDNSSEDDDDEQTTEDEFEDDEYAFDDDFSVPRRPRVRRSSRGQVCICPSGTRCVCGRPNVHSQTNSQECLYENETNSEGIRMVRIEIV